MTCVNKDGSIDVHYTGSYIRCDNCSYIENVWDDEKDVETEQGIKYFKFEEMRRHIFKGVGQKDLPRDLCNKCYEKAIPYFYQIRDIIELDVFNNKLKGAINERRKNNRSAQINAG